MKYALLVLLAGCSSLVSDPCMPGYSVIDGVCTPDGLTGTFIPPPPEVRGELPDPRGPKGTVPLVCELPTIVCNGTCMDLSADPDNCGHCGRVCSSGICAASSCVGDLPGHIIAIGHDYAAADAAMDRVLGNAVGAAGGTTIRVGWWQGTATQQGAVAAAHRGLAQTARASSDLTITTITPAQLGEVDTVVIEPQLGDGDAAEASGGQAAGALASFLASGHVVVVLETTGGVSYRYAAGAALFTVAAPVDATATQVTVAAPADVVAAGVVSPYFAKTSSVGYPGVAQPVIVDGAGDAVVFHATY